MNKLYLCSQSPRRQALLKQINLNFEVINAPIEEVGLPKENPQSFVIRMAVEKALAGFNKVAGKKIWVVGSDTAVLAEDKLLGKPKNEADARRMLKILSGKTHYVLSSVAVVFDGVVYSALNETQVTFKTLSDQEISSYWHSQEPLGKAGSYAIQGLGAKFIEEIKGSYSAVMGMPLFELNQLLEQAGYEHHG